MPGEVDILIAILAIVFMFVIAWLLDRYYPDNKGD